MDKMRLLPQEGPSMIPNPRSNMKGSSAFRKGQFEDITPRERPAPHHLKAPSAEPTVPEVTIFFDGQSAETSYNELPPPRAPLADIYGPVQNQQPLTRATTTALKKPNVPASQNGHYVPRSSQSHDIYAEPVPRRDPRQAVATSSRANPQYVPTSQYQPQMSAPVQRPTPVHQAYVPHNAQPYGANHGAMSRPRQAPVPYNYTCIPATSVPRRPAHPQEAPRPGPRGEVYPPHSDYDPQGYYQVDPRTRRAVNGYPHQYPVTHYQPAPGPSRIDPKVNGKMTLAETMQNLNIRVKPTSPGSGSGSATESLNSSTESNTMTVPPDVYELLRMQDAQLKELREQLAKLMAQQAESQKEAKPVKQAVTLSTQTSMCETCHNRNDDLCSIGINTSFIQEPSHQYMPTQTASVQTSPTAESLNHSFTNTDVRKFSLPGRSSHAGQQRKASPNYRRSDSYPGKKQRTPESRSSPGDRLRLPSSLMTSPGDADQDESYTLSGIQLAQIQAGTEESMMSEMNIDMPAYTSLTPQKTSSGEMADSEDSSGSPGFGESVSMYARGESVYDQAPNPQEDTGFGETSQEAQLAVDYKQLIGNVQKLLGKHTNDDNSADTGLNLTEEGTQNGTIDNRLEYSNTLSHNDTLMNNSVHSMPPENRSRHSNDGSMHSQHSASNMTQEKTYSVPSTPAQGMSVNKSIDFTRRQLEKMGIFLDSTTTSTDQSRIDQSLFLDTEFLPRVEYESLHFTDDSDLSTCADQLAMKYLTDEQLSELARLKPSTHRRTMGRVANPNTTLSNPMNHMSFATRKYMERYGLLENNASGDVSTQGNSDGPELVNVTAFLANLHDNSFVDDSNNMSHHNQSLSQSCNGALPDPTSTKQQSCCSASSISDHIGGTQHYYSDGDSHVGAQRPAVNAALHRMSTPKAPNAAAHDVSDLGATPKRASNRPVMVFSKTQANTDNLAQDTHYASEKAPVKSTPQRVLDIERLKELPKLI